jgi:hypothetical protein
MKSLPATPVVRLATSELEDYFASISDSFEGNWAASQRRDYVSDFLDVPLFLSMLSVLPLIPTMVWSIVHFRYPNSRTVAAGWAVPIQSFLFWWCVCVILSIPLAVLSSRVDGWRSKRALRDQLSIASTRFALCYATVQELDRFAKNGLQKHAEKALLYWTQLQILIQGMFNVFGGGRNPSTSSPAPVVFAEYSEEELDASLQLAAKGLSAAHVFRLSSPFRRVVIFQQRFPWFKLEPTTSKILNALSSLPLKITTRLRDRKDLPSLISALSDFASYLYTLIPEVSSTGRYSDSELALVGEESLIRFASSLDALGVYKPEPRPLEGKEKVRSKLTLVICWFDELFVHETPLVRFIVWWALGQAIVMLGLVVARHYVPDLKFDSTLISLIIGTPLVVSAAALASAFRKR